MNLRKKIRLRSLEEEGLRLADAKYGRLRTNWEQNDAKSSDLFDRDMNINSINLSSHVAKTTEEEEYEIEKTNFYRMLRLRKRNTLQNQKIVIDPSSKLFKVTGETPKHLLCLQPENDKIGEQRPMQIHSKLFPTINDREENKSSNRVKLTREMLLNQHAQQSTQIRSSISPNKQFERILVRYSEDLKRKNSEGLVDLRQDVVSLIKSSNKLSLDGSLHHSSRRPKGLNETQVNEHLNITKASLLQSPKSFKNKGRIKLTRMAK